MVCVDCRRLFQKHFRASLSVCSWKQGVTMSNLTVVTQLFYFERPVVMGKLQHCVYGVTSLHVTDCGGWPSFPALQPKSQSINKIERQ